MIEPAAIAEDLAFRYGRDGFELRVASFALERGERVALIGPSGSGKSTFLHLLAGILLPDRGRVVVTGKEWSRLRDAERRRARITGLGLVFQEFELLEHLSVRENILLPYFVNPALPLEDTVEARMRALAESAGIGALLARRPGALSHGERQRVAICRGLVTGPELLLADEPTGNLDPETTSSVLRMLLDVVGEGDASLLLVTHDHGLLDRFDRVIDVAALDQEGGG